MRRIPLHVTGVLCILLLCCVLPARGDADPALERRGPIAAAALYYFAKFTTWPPEYFSSKNSSHFSICVLGNDPLNAHLYESVRRKKVHRRKIVVHLVARIERRNQLKRCEVLYFGKNMPQPDAELFRWAEETNTLTVGSSPKFLSWGGMVRLVDSGEKISFAVSLKNVRRGALTISPDVLALAELEE